MIILVISLSSSQRQEETRFNLVLSFGQQATILKEGFICSPILEIVARTLQLHCSGHFFSQSHNFWYLARRHVVVFVIVIQRSRDTNPIASMLINNSF